MPGCKTAATHKTGTTNLESSMKNILLHTAFIMILFLVSQSFIFAQVVVSPHGPVTSIKEAVQMAGPGETIEVHSGIYY